MLKISQGTIDEMIGRASRQAPEVVCGLLGGRDQEICHVCPCTNTSQRPEETYHLESDEILANRQIMEASGLDLRGIYYSQASTSLTTPEPPPEQVLAWDICVVILLPKSQTPTVRAYQIAGEEVREISLEIFSGVTLPSAAIQNVRREFAGNHFLGWAACLDAFQTSLSEKDYPACLALIAELKDATYEISPTEESRLQELRDIVLYRQGNLGALWAYYMTCWHNREAMAEPTAEAAIRLRLGGIFERKGEFSAARAHYQASLALWEAAGDAVSAQNARQMLFVLEHHERTGTSHEYFEALWQPIVSGTIDTEKEVAYAATEALLHNDWRRACEAVESLERKGGVNELAKGLQSKSRVVRLAVVAALGRVTNSKLEDAAKDANPLVRRQAALALGRSTSDTGYSDDLASRIAFEPFERMGYPMSDQQEQEEEGMLRMSFAEHLTELLYRLGVVLLAFLLVAVITSIILPGSWLYRASMALGYALVCTSPLAYIEAVNFVKPGFYRRERRLIHPIGLPIVAFVGGCLFLTARFICMPLEHLWSGVFRAADSDLRFTPIGVLVKAAVIDTWFVWEVGLALAAWFVLRSAFGRRGVRNAKKLLVKGCFSVLKLLAACLIPVAIVTIGVWVLLTGLLVAIPAGIVFLRFGREQLHLRVQLWCSSRLSSWGGDLGALIRAASR